MQSAREVNNLAAPVTEMVSLIQDAIVVAKALNQVR